MVFLLEDDVKYLDLSNFDPNLKLYWFMEGNVLIYYPVEKYVLGVF